MFRPVLNLLSRKGRPARPAKAARPSPRFRPTLQCLEDRTVPAFTIRATALSSAGLVIASDQLQVANGPGNPPAMWNTTVGGFVITSISTITATSLGQSTQGTLVQIQSYTGPTGAGSQQLLVELLGDSYVNPNPGTAIIGSCSLSTSSAINFASNAVMTSGVINGTASLGALPAVLTAYGPLTGELGERTAAGSFPASSANYVNAPPGATFTIANPFSFYQSYTISGIMAAGANTANFTGTTHVEAVPTSTGSTGTIGFWQNKNGQDVIMCLNGGKTATALGTWLAKEFPELYGADGANLGGKTNEYIANYYKNSLFSPSAATKKYAQVLALAFAVYVTDTDLNSTTAGQDKAKKFGFQLSATGTGGALYNIGSKGTILGLNNNQVYTVMDILKAMEAKTTNGVLSDPTAIGGIADDINNFFDI